MSEPILHYADSSDERYKHIPEGKALVWATNGGFVGTSSGWPHSGQPALYPLEQAKAIVFAIGLLGHLGRDKVIELLPRPEAVDEQVWHYMGWEPPTEKAND